MPCTVKCRCGKATMRFEKMNPGDIEVFECPRCDGELEKKKPAAPVPAQRGPSNPYGKPLKKQAEKQAQKAEQAPVEDEE